MARRFLEQVEQRGDEGVDPATQVLEVEQEHIGAGHHLAGGAAHLAIEAEHGDAIDGIGLVAGLDHIVLLVALQTMLWAEGAGDVHPGGDQCVERMGEIPRHRSRMRDERDAFAVERPAQGGVGKQPVDTEFHGGSGAASLAVKQAGSWKSGLPVVWFSAQ